MELKGIKRIPAVILPLMMLAACNGGEGAEDTDAGSDPAIWAVSGDSVSENTEKIPEI